MGLRAVLLFSAGERISHLWWLWLCPERAKLPYCLFPASAGWGWGACCGWEDYLALRVMVLLPLPRAQGLGKEQSQENRCLQDGPSG